MENASCVPSQHYRVTQNQSLGESFFLIFSRAYSADGESRLLRSISNSRYRLPGQGFRPLLRRVLFRSLLG